MTLACGGFLSYLKLTCKIDLLIALLLDFYFMEFTDTLISGYGLINILTTESVIKLIISETPDPGLLSLIRE